MILKKITKLLSYKEKKQAIILTIITLIMATLDMIGVASILPFLAVLISPELIETNIILSKLYFVLEFETQNDFIFFLGLASFILLVLSLIIKSLTTYLQLRFALYHEFKLGKRLVEGYLNQPYKWFLNRNSAEISKSILSEVSAVVNGCLMPMIALITQFAVAISIILLLILVDPKISLIIGTVFILAYTILYKSVSKYLHKLGTQRTKDNEQRFTIVSEAFGAFKEVKVSGIEDFFVDRFIKPAKSYAKNEASASIIRQLPRYGLELIAFGGMLLVILNLISKNGGFFDAIPILALYVFAGYRLMPAIQQIYSSLTQLKFIGPVLDSIYKDISNLENKVKNIDEKKIEFKKMISFEKISYTYPNESIPAIKDLDLKIPCKKKIGIIGVTGSGKTTVVDLILGLLKPQNGFLKIDDLLINDQNKRSWQSIVGYVPQQIYLSDDTIAANIAFGINKDEINYKNIEEVAKMANLHKFVSEDLKNGYQTIVGERGVRLSGGQRQRIGIARALYRKPELLIFDEATNALDNITEKSVLESIKQIENNITIIMIAHRLNTVRNCDNIFLLEKGNLIAQGSYDELLRKNSSFYKMAKENEFVT
jgi:ATP-binding cassette, subfamily B, bacterial PglK